MGEVIPTTPPPRRPGRVRTVREKEILHKYPLVCAVVRMKPSDDLPGYDQDQRARRKPGWSDEPLIPSDAFAARHQPQTQKGNAQRGERVIEVRNRQHQA